MSDWHESEAKQECLDLRIKVRELEAENTKLREAAQTVVDAREPKHTMDEYSRAIDALAALLEADE